MEYETAFSSSWVDVRRYSTVAKRTYTSTSTSSRSRTTASSLKRMERGNIYSYLPLMVHTALMFIELNDDVRVKDDTHRERDRG
eukprot:13041451-Heterocapsa_arctica.AAC.1